jgi:hypothetical protein
MAVWYSLWSFGIFFPFWYIWTKKNLATLQGRLDEFVKTLAKSVALPGADF